MVLEIIATLLVVAEYKIQTSPSWTWTMDNHESCNRFTNDANEGDFNLPYRKLGYLIARLSCSSWSTVKDGNWFTTMQ
jgi:hypothetical protein